MAEQRKEVDAIANNGEAPTFENTIIALERSGRILYRTSATFFNLQSADTDPELDAVETEVAPKLAAHQDAIYLDAQLFARVKTLHDAGAALHLDPSIRNPCSSARAYIQSYSCRNVSAARRCWPDFRVRALRSSG